MPGWNDPTSLILRLEAVLVRVEAEMPILRNTVSLVLRLEATLQRLETENFEPPGSCCACLQDVVTTGHLPSCPIALDLQAIREWKQSVAPEDVRWN